MFGAWHGYVRRLTRNVSHGVDLDLKKNTAILTHLQPGGSRESKARVRVDVKGPRGFWSPQRNWSHS